MTSKQAWALMHMLRRGPAEYRALFDDLVDELQNRPSREVLAQHFSPERIRKLERDLEAYIVRLGKNR